MWRSEMIKDIRNDKVEDFAAWYQDKLDEQEMVIRRMKSLLQDLYGSAEKWQQKIIDEVLEDTGG